MQKLACVMMAAGLGMAMAMSGSAPYDQAARHMEINKATAAEVLKADAHQAVMREALDQPPLPAGMALVMPEPGGTRVLARAAIVG